MSLLVLDIGTTNVRAVRVGVDGSVEAAVAAPVPLQRPSAGVVEHDAVALGAAILEVARAAVASEPVAAVGIATQRATTVVWDRRTGEPVAPAISWQDLRTVGQCLALRREGLALLPSQSATKLAYLLDRFDRERGRDLCFGTVDTYATWVLSGGRLHVTDLTNAAVTGLVDLDATGWDTAVLERLHIPERLLPRLVPSTGVVGEASALAGAPPIAALVGDQQASLVGQGCLKPGDAKATFGTGGMLDCTVGETRPAFATRGAAGTFPIVAWHDGAGRHWGVEAIMLSAGSCIEWCCRLGLIATPADSDALASSVRDAGSVVFVPALEGLGTPRWDFGARGAFLGLDGSTGRAELVRAVLDGVAQRGADLLEAVELDAGVKVEQLRVDGGMSANATFLQLLADATGRVVVPFPAREATVLGAAFLAGVAVGTFADLGEATATQAPGDPIAPRRRSDRGRWLEARGRAEKTIPFLSALAF